MRVHANGMPLGAGPRGSPQVGQPKPHTPGGGGDGTGGGEGEDGGGEGGDGGGDG